MAERNPEKRDFVGKTIARIDTRACNLWRFFFTDGTAIAIEADCQSTQYGGVPVMQVCEECAQPEPEDAP
jgi:hypothetical protein